MNLGLGEGDVKPRGFFPNLLPFHGFLSQFSSSGRLRGPEGILGAGVCDVADVERALQGHVSPKNPPKIPHPPQIRGFFGIAFPEKLRPPHPWKSPRPGSGTGWDFWFSNPNHPRVLGFERFSKIISGNSHKKTGRGRGWRTQSREDGEAFSPLFNGKPAIPGIKRSQNPQNLWNREGTMDVSSPTGTK